MILGLELLRITRVVEVVDLKLELEEQYWLLEEEYPKIDLG